MVAEFELIQERKISGKGVLKVPPDKQKNRAYILYASVVRPPKNAYKNFNYNPPRGRYGFLTFMRDDYVLHNASMEYLQQAYDGVNDIAGQTLYALKCANNAILQSILNLSVALAATPGGQGLQPVNFQNVIKEYTNLRLAWNECRFVCYADTAVSLRLYRLQYDVCNEDFKDDIPSPPPPPPPTPVLPGTPIFDISSPYDPTSEKPSLGDDGNTEPFPGDVPPPPPPTPAGVATALLFSITYIYGNQAGQTVNGYANAVTPYYVTTDSATYIRVHSRNADGTYSVATPIAVGVGGSEKWFDINYLNDYLGYVVDVRYE